MMNTAFAAEIVDVTLRVYLATRIPR